MHIVEILLIGISLSMDAFAVAVCRGLRMKNKINWRQMLIIALFFGGFQALMPLIGWALGSQLEQYITAIDHWITFALLLFIGGKMILDVIRESKEDKPSDNPDGEEEDRLDIKELFLLAIATSIDALAMGITFAFMNVKIWSTISIIGSTTFAISLAGVLIGHRFGTRFQSGATLAGGIILILIGVKILLEHLGVLVLPF